LSSILFLEIKSDERDRREESSRRAALPLKGLHYYFFASGMIGKNARA
jgi:hypothetical protein